jgi:hypothetical protein
MPGDTGNIEQRACVHHMRLLLSIMMSSCLLSRQPTSVVPQQRQHVRPKAVVPFHEHTIMWEAPVPTARQQGVVG